MLIVAVLAVLLVALLLIAGVERLLRALKIERQAPDEASRGLREVVERAGRAAERRRQERERQRREP